MRNKLAIIIALFSFVSSVSAGDFPFVDVPLGSPNYIAIKTLYENKVIIDDGSHKFQPNELLTRDDLVGFMMGASCNSCLNPSAEEIALYQVSPFPDLKMDNPYYYCIAKAVNESSITGYPTDQTGKVFCEDGQSFTKESFCQNNKTSRILAAVILLRKANLWNDVLNAGFQKSLTINDVASNWYGYAQKAIEFGIIGLSSDGKINPDESITRGEFATMAAKILEYSQCSPTTTKNKTWSNILLQESNGNFLNQSSISKDTNISIIGLTSDIENSTFLWKAKDAITGKIVAETGPILSSNKLGIGRWFIHLTVGNKAGNEKISASNLTLTIADGGGVTGGNITSNIASVNSNDIGIGGVVYPSISLIAAPNSPGAGGNVSFTTAFIGNGALKYRWDFGDGTRSTTTIPSGSTQSNAGKIDHVYSLPGIYTAYALMTDESGKSAIGSVIVEVTGNSDTDGDGVDDSLDICPEIKGSSTSKGCPDVSTNLYTAGGFLSSNSTKNMSFSATAPNASNNSNIFSNMSAANSNTDTDNDGITDDIDACPTISGNSNNGGCPLVGSFLGSIESNGCAMNQIEDRGGIIIEPICEICPCPTSVSLGSTLRRCDIIFPAILSKDFLNIYSRGPLYQIP